MDKWCYLSDENYRIKQHICTAKSSPLVLAQMISKAAKPRMEMRNKASFEPGGYGMRSTQWPTLDIVFMGNTLVLEVDKVIELYSELKSKSEPDFTCEGHDFYYSFSRMNVLVFSTEERAAVLTALEGQLDEANKQANKFLEAFEASWAEMEKKYKEKHGTSFPIVRVKPPVSPAN